MARRAYAPGPPLPAHVGTWSYEDYRRIRFKVERTLWRGEGIPFEVDFFPRGARFDQLVRINVLTGGDGRVLDFDPSMYLGWPSGVRAEDQSQLGFAGLRARYPLSGPVPHEFAAFLGGSYFRAAGRGQLYGASARCVAIDTGTDRPEEFPAFREFWLTQPAPGSDVFVLYGLLDSPSLTGAFEFDLRPGSPTRMNVTGALYARREVRKLALAPVSSMFLFGETRARAFDDFRPEVHDSDGLLIASATGEWFWRPLDNPSRLRVSRVPGTGIRGFWLCSATASSTTTMTWRRSIIAAPAYRSRPDPTGAPGPSNSWSFRVPSSTTTMWRSSGSRSGPSRRGSLEWATRSSSAARKSTRHPRGAWSVRSWARAGAGAFVASSLNSKGLVSKASQSTRYRPS